MWRSGVRKANRCDPDQPGDYLVRLMPSDRPSAAVDAYTVGSTDTLGWLTEWPPQLPDRPVSGNMSPASSPSPGDRPAPQADVFSCPPWAARPTPVSGCPRRTPAGLADGYPRECRTMAVDQVRSGFGEPSAAISRRARTPVPYFHPHRCRLGPREARQPTHVDLPCGVSGAGRSRTHHPPLVTCPACTSSAGRASVCSLAQR